MNLINPLLDDDSHLFTLPSDVAISKSLKKWVTDAGIRKNISFYCGRHTFGTLLARQGTNLNVIADCMGHASTWHTVKYLNHVDDLKAKAIANLPDLTGE